MDPGLSHRKGLGFKGGDSICIPESFSRVVEGPGRDLWSGSFRVPVTAPSHFPYTLVDGVLECTKNLPKGSEIWGKPKGPEDGTSPTEKGTVGSW